MAKKPAPEESDADRPYLTVDEIDALREAGATGLVRVYPMPYGYIEGVPHKVMDVPPWMAERLTVPDAGNFPLGVFVSDRADVPEWWAPPDPDGLLSTPAEPAEPPAEPAEEAEV